MYVGKLVMVYFFMFCFFYICLYNLLILFFQLLKYNYLSFKELINDLIFLKNIDDELEKVRQVSSKDFKILVIVIYYIKNDLNCFKFSVINLIKDFINNLNVIIKFFLVKIGVFFL